MYDEKGRTAFCERLTIIESTATCLRDLIYECIPTLGISPVIALRSISAYGTTFLLVASKQDSEFPNSWDCLLFRSRSQL